MLEALKSVVDELAGADPAALADEEAMVALWRELARMEAVVARASAAFEAARGHEASGARSTPAWIAWRCKVARPSAARRVALGRALVHLPATEAAWVAGEITESQVSALAAARTPATEAALERDEAMLVEQAKRLRVHHFGRAMAYWGAHADPDGAEDGAERRRAERRLRLRRDFDGTRRGEWVLDEVSGAIVANQLERIEDELFAEDWAEGTERLGKANVCSDRLRRSAAQRRADALAGPALGQRGRPLTFGRVRDPSRPAAVHVVLRRSLVEMARRAGAAPAEGRRPEPLFTILVNYECFAGPICALADGTVVTPGTAARWLEEGWAERVVFGPDSRPIDVGQRRRIFTGATRRAVQVRDQECFHDSCDQSAGRCQVDHVVPWAVGGPTTVENGRAACGPHNRARNRRGPPGEG